MKKRILLFTILVLTIACSKEEGTNTEQSNNIVLNLELNNNTSFSSSFEYNYSSQLENIKLIWNNVIEVNIENKIGEKEVLNNNSSLTIYNLEHSKSYFFRLVGELNNQKYYSEIITVITSEIELTFNSNIIENTYKITKVINKNNGFILGTFEFSSGQYSTDHLIRISKINNQFNQEWSFTINELEWNDLYEIIDLEDGNFIAICTTSNGTNIGKVFAIKFDNNGNQIWKKYYPYQDWQSGLVDFNSYENEIYLMALVNKQGHQYFYREFSIDSDGNIIIDQNIDVSDNFYFYFLAYQPFGEKFDVGAKYIHNNNQYLLDAMIEKYDTNNDLIWSKQYGDEGRDVFEKTLIDEDYIITAGFNNHSTGVPLDFDTYKWVHVTDKLGNKIWEYEENRKNFIYHAYDIKKDNDNDILALFFDIYYPGSHVYNKATLLKFDSLGNLLWTFKDGEDYNTDDFHPKKVIHKNGEYLIFGIKEGNTLWLKKIKVN